MIKLMVMILRDHIRSQRILVELVVMAATAFLVLRNVRDSQAMQASLVLYSFVMALYTTSVVADSNEQPVAVQRLLAMPNRETLLPALIGSVVAITGLSYILLSVAGTILNPLAMPTLSITLMAIPSVILVIVTAIIIMLLMTPLVASTSQRLAILMVLTIPIAWNIVVSMVNLSMPQVDGAIISAVTTLWGIMLWPGFTVYNHAVTPEYNMISIVMHLVHTVVIAGLSLLVRRWFRRKDLTIA